MGVCMCVPTEKKIARESVIKYICVLWAHSCFHRARGARHLRLSLAHVWEATGSPATWTWGLLQLPICLRGPVEPGPFCVRPGCWQKQLKGGQRWPQGRAGLGEECSVLSRKRYGGISGDFTPRVSFHLCSSMQDEE